MGRGRVAGTLRLTAGVLVWLAPAIAGAPDRVIESVIPALGYGPSCSSVITLKNLAESPVRIDIEGHRASGALAPLQGESGMNLILAPGQQAAYKLQIEEETTAAWVKVRERIPAARASPAIAISGSTECRAGNQIRTAVREIAYPTHNPWFSGGVAELRGDMLSVINASERSARVWVCYSSGNLYFVPGSSIPAGTLMPICSGSLDIQIPPFSTREIPVDRDGNTHFSIRTRADAMVLQMLRPAAEGARIFTVDSSIQFGGEVPDR